MKTVALANGAFSDEERALLEAVAEALSIRADLGALDPAGPRAIAEAFEGQEERQHVLQMLVVMAMVDGDANDAEKRVIRDFARALGLDKALIERARSMAMSHLNMLRLDMVRRLPPRAEGEPESKDDEGWMGVWKVFGAASRAGVNTEMAWRHKGFGLLPDGTLGRVYWEYMTSRRFLFPGERGAILPDAGLHDFLHALTGYDTSMTGEVELAAFTAGLKKMEDPFALIFGTLCVSHLGERLVSGGAPPSKMELDPARVGAAFRRGLFAAPELTEEWSFLSDVERPIDELLRRYHIVEG